VAYGYFPCGREGNARAWCSIPQATGDSPPGAAGPLGRFDLPRQRAGNRYCIADFYRDLRTRGRWQPHRHRRAADAGRDHGRNRPRRSPSSCSQPTSYSDYLYFHGLAVQMAEALANGPTPAFAARARLPDPEPDTCRDVLAQRYRGSRYSFGYPGLPRRGLIPASS
jgi:5-methyltetrahydrofolate--homocysteine methyltransferase